MINNGVPTGVALGAFVHQSYFDQSISLLENVLRNLYGVGLGVTEAYYLLSLKKN